MARLAHGIDYDAQLQQIRSSYVAAAPRQRLSVILQRLEDHHFGPNRLVTAVSAVEALARCLLQHAGAKTKGDVAAAYPRYKKWAATSLVRGYLATQGITDPVTYLEEDNWRLLGYAVEYRNVLVHECTYLGLDKFPSLIESCEAVLEKLVNLGHVRTPPA